MMNFVGSFFGSFATAGALSRSILQDTTGGNTQVKYSSLSEIHTLYIRTVSPCCSMCASEEKSGGTYVLCVLM